MKQSRVTAVLGMIALVLVWPAAGVASPITYTDLVSGIPVFGVNTQPSSSQNDPVGANYYRFLAGAGSSVEVVGDRLDGHFDMAFWIFSGSFGDTNAFGAAFDVSDSSFARFGDDEDAPNLPGPYGDPHESFIAPTTGWYTVAVTNYLSSSNANSDFRLVVDVPEPGSLLLLVVGVSGIAVASRRRRAS